MLWLDKKIVFEIQFLENEVFLIKQRQNPYSAVVHHTGTNRTHHTQEHKPCLTILRKAERPKKVRQPVAELRGCCGSYDD